MGRHSAPPTGRDDAQADRTSCDGGGQAVYPPAGCGYQVLYIDRAGRRVESPVFADEYALGDWFKDGAESGEIDRTAEAEGRPGGFRIYCVAEDRRIEIDHLHPRLVHGRLNRRARTP